MTDCHINHYNFMYRHNSALSVEAFLFPKRYGRFQDLRVLIDVLCLSLHKTLIVPNMESNHLKHINLKTIKSFTYLPENPLQILPAVERVDRLRRDRRDAVHRGSGPQLTVVHRGEVLIRHGSRPRHLIVLKLQVVQCLQTTWAVTKIIRLNKGP